MGLYRDETGRLLEMDDGFAEARGYSPADPVESGAIITQQADAARGEERGVVGDINALATGAASGLTAGLSDVLLGETLNPLERQRLLAEMEAHPYLRGGGEVAGAVAASLAAPGSALARTPTGYLSTLATGAVETGLERGGIVGTAKALGAMGLEGAAQNAGQYFGHAALEDKETTAEGLNGALGTGFAFGTLGGGAALGVSKGAMAGRRLYSRVMDGEKAAKAAESAWSLASEEALTADLATARAAETKLENIRKAKLEAMRYRNETRAATQDERIRASTAERPAPEADFEAGIPTDVRAMPQEAGLAGETAVAQTSSVRPEDIGPMPLDEGIAPAKGGQVTAVRPPTTKKIPRPEGVQAEAAATDLESQLAGTKAKLDEGVALKDIEAQKPPKASKGNESDSIEGWLNEKRDLSQARKIEDLKGAEELRTRRQETLSEIRYKATEDLLGPQVAKEEQALMDAVEEFHAAYKDVDGLRAAPWGGTDGPRVSGPDEGPIPTIDTYGIETGVGRAPRGGDTKVASPGNRHAIQILDDAHEEALLRAKHAADPAEAGRAITEAAHLEDLLEGLAVPDMTPELKGVSRAQLRSARGEQAIDDLLPDVKKVQRYEAASAKLSDVMGDMSHPTSVAKAKALRDAERDSERKVFDRQARAVDDTESFGPEYKTPKERVRYARERQNDAQRNLDELGVQEREAVMESARANKIARAGEKAKKAALRADAKAAKPASDKMGAAGWGALLEIADIPGMPKPSDLPVVGPLLGAYLKYKAFKKVMGRFAGRVPATADNRVAALAAQTRDRIARALDRSLGVVERSARTSMRAIPSASAVLAQRIYDDGGPTPKDGASVTELAAARMREVAAYVHAPNAIELDVRRELRGVVDPDIIAAAEQHRRAIMEHLLKNSPKVPEQSILNRVDWQPSGAESMAFARRYEALSDPASVFERLAHEQAMLSLEAAQALREVYPKLFSEAQQRLMERAQERDLKVPMRTRVQMSLLFQVPLDTALDPANLKITQSVYERKPSSPAYNPAAPGAATPPPSVPQSSVAQPTNLAQAYTPSLDRR